MQEINKTWVRFVNFPSLILCLLSQSLREAASCFNSIVTEEISKTLLWNSGHVQFNPGWIFWLNETPELFECWVILGTRQYCISQGYFAILRRGSTSHHRLSPVMIRLATLPNWTLIQDERYVIEEYLQWLNMCDGWLLPETACWMRIWLKITSSHRPTFCL